MKIAAALLALLFLTNCVVFERQRGFTREYYTIP